ncbi:MAG: hypothetical protein O3C40_27675 [Planctomycetota bacterium]|nr:hypothetical protein [Planctomycetota bacterium]
MYKSLSVMLIAFAVSTPAHADNFGFFASNVGPEQIVDGSVYGPMQNGVVDGSMHGYPFYSGCCEPKSSCCEGLWDGFCGSQGCGMKAGRARYHGHVKGGCGCGASGGMVQGYSSYGKGGCGSADSCGWGGKSSGRHMSYRGLGGKGGCGKGSCGVAGACGSKGCNTCDPCGPKHQCRLGLFDWLHFGHGHGCSVCGGVGCSSCAGGKGGYMNYGPVQGYDKSYYGTPTETDENPTLQPPEVLVEPTPVSDRSAWRRQAPVNPFARPFSY